MDYLVLDTCVWIDLAVTEYSLVPKLTKLISEGKLRLVVPELVVAEWQGCEQRMLSQISNEIIGARRAALKLFSLIPDCATKDITDRISTLDPMAAASRICAERIKAVNALLLSSTAIALPVTSEANALAIKHAMEKKAPFRARNSMADALIFFSTVEWANQNHSERCVFVTHNIKDFSAEKRDENDDSKGASLDSALAAYLANNRLEYGTAIGKVLNTIETHIATAEEVELSETVVKQVSIKTDLDEYIFVRGRFAKTLEDQKWLEELVSGGPVAKMFEDQRRMEELVSSGPVAKMIEDQKRMEELVSGGPVAKIIEDQKRMEELVSGGPVAKMIEDQRRMEELMSGGPIAKIFEDHTSAGMIRKILENNDPLK